MIKMKKKLGMICSIVLLSFSALAFAQEDGKGIIFEKEGTTFQQGVQKALSGKKLIFMDCYTSWCGPCKLMASQVFTKEVVGNFMNPNYVSLKVNMEKGEGLELVKKLQISAYPTFIIFDSHGNELGRFLGSCKEEEFIEKVKKASVDSSSAEMDKRFANGERDEKFLHEYLKTLGSAYKRDQCSLVAEALLKDKESSFADDAILSDIFMKYISDPFTPAFIYTVKNPAKLIARFGDVPVRMKTQNVWRSYPQSLITTINEKTTIDSEKFEKLLKLMNECEVKNKEEIRLETLITLAEKQSDWDSYVKYCTEYSNNPDFEVTDLMLCKWCTPIAMKCTEKAPRQVAIAMLQKRIDDLNSGRAKPQTKQGNMTISGNLKAAMEKLIETLNKE